MEVMMMSEKKDVKIQARLGDEEDKKLIEETLEQVKENKGLNNIGQAFKYVFQEFNKTNNLSEKSLNSYFMSELEELKGIGERIPQLFQLMIEKTEREMEKTQNQTSSQLKEKNEIIEELNQHIIKLDDQMTTEIEIRDGQLQELEEKHAAEISKKDKEINLLESDLRSAFDSVSKAGKQVKALEDDNQKLKDRNEILDKKLMHKESLESQLYKEKENLKEDYRRLEKVAQDAVSTCKELEEKFEIQRQQLIEEHKRREQELQDAISSLETRLDETNQKHMEFLQGILSKDTQNADEKPKKSTTSKANK